MPQLIDKPLLPRSGGGRKSIYPWDEWLDGQHRVFTEEDSNCPLKNFRKAVYSAAKRKGVSVLTSMDDDGLHVQAQRSAPSVGA